MTERPTVSIVIATYNRSRSLSECLQCLEKQTVAPFEIVVVIDGGEIDESQKAIGAFESRSRLKIVQVVNRANVGAPISKNRGAEAASGHIVAFVDDDIKLAPEWIDEIIKGFEENDDTVAVGGRCEMSRWLYRGRLYEILLAARGRLFRSKFGKLSFVGVPYVAHVFPADGYITSDFLHGGITSVLRESFLSNKLDPSMGVRDEYDMCIRLRKNSGGKLIYNSRAIGYHEVTTDGGFGVWGHQRAALDIRDNVPYLMKNFNLRYLRLTAFCALVFTYSLLTFNLIFVKALWDGLKRFRSWQRYQQQVATSEEGE